MALTAGRLAAGCWLPLFGIWALACSVDHRHLHRGSTDDMPGEGASPSASASACSENGTAGTRPQTGGASADGGAGGAAPEPMPTGGTSTSPGLPPLLKGCADLDTDSVPDCTVTLVKNPTFKSDVESWAPVDAAKLTWDPRNALGDTPSGCALVSATGKSDIDGSVLYRATQCVTVPAKQIVIAYASALVDTTAAAADSPQAQLEVSFFDAEDCGGVSTGQFSTPPSDASGWTTIQAGMLAGAATTSALVALVGIKPFRADGMNVCFDNVMVKTKAPSP